MWWAIAGGWAIDLWLGTAPTREHHDIEIIIRRDRQTQLVAAVPGARWTCIDPPGSGWRPWDGDPLIGPAFQLKADLEGVSLDVFAETVIDGVWHFRRDARVTLPVDELTAPGAGGLPVVRPEVQLLYMAASTDPKNEHDFVVAEPWLSPPARSWLRSSLELIAPEHRWLRRL
jgi:hypothetical protein